MSTTVETSKGKPQGTTEGGVSVFRGIPFAQPPVVPSALRRLSTSGK